MVFLRLIAEIKRGKKSRWEVTKCLRHDVDSSVSRFLIHACRWFWKHCGVPRDGLYSDLVDMRSWLSLDLPMDDWSSLIPGSRQKSWNEIETLSLQLCDEAVYAWSALGFKKGFRFWWIRFSMRWFIQHSQIYFCICDISFHFISIPFFLVGDISRGLPQRRCGRTAMLYLLQCAALGMLFLNVPVMAWQEVR